MANKQGNSYFRSIAAKAASARREKESSREREKAAKAESKTAKLRRAGVAVKQGLGSTRNFLTKERKVPAIATGALKSLSFLIIGLGLLQYFLRLSFSGTTTVTFYLSIFLFILAGYALSTKVQIDKVATFIPMLLFVIWYFIFGGSFDPRFLLTFLPIAVAVLILPAIFTKNESTKPELLGLLPVLFLFLDIGMIPWLIENFQLPVTGLLDGLVLFMPWWALFGLFVLPNTENPTTDFVVSVLRITGIVYILFVLVIPAIPDLGYDSSLVLPEAEELEAAQERLRGKLPQGENPFVSNLACVLSSPTDVSSCVEQRQLLASLETVCKNRNLKPGTTEFNTCFEEEQEKQRLASLEAAGTIDRSFEEVTRAEFVISEQFFPKETIRSADQELSVIYPATLKIENPRLQEINVQVTCSFVKGSTIIPGEINLQGESQTTVRITDENNEFPVTCTPPTNLEGRHRLRYEAKLENLKTTSSLKRAFLGEKTEQEKQEVIEQIQRTIFPSRTDSLSQAPDEFARINFGFGKTADDPYIAADDSLILVSSIGNVGDGKINQIKSYDIKLFEAGFTLKSGDDRCLQGSNIPFPDTLSSKTPYVLPYSTCFLNLPSHLQFFDTPFEIETFFADLVYDYTLKKEINIEVKVIPVTSGELIS